MSNKELLRRARRELMPGVIYVIIDKHGEPTSWGDTADGVGMYWYDTLADVAVDYDIDETPMVALTEEELEEIRHGN